MSIVYSPIEFTGPAFEEVFMELLFQNETVAQEKVRLINGIKNETVITEMGVTVNLQAYVCGVPTPSGSIDMNDALLRPCKLMAYDEFCPDDLRFSRFASSMRAGAWENVSEEWVRIVLETYGVQMSRQAEEDFWNGASAATKVAVAAAPLGPNLTAEEKAYVAAAPLTLCDGIVTYLIYNNGAVGTSIDVVGTTITALNIWDEYKAVYSVIPTVMLKPSNIGMTKIFAPESHAQLIQLYNTDQTFRDKFLIDAQGNFYFLGVKIEFVPLPEDTMIAARWSDILWGTDSTADFSYLQIDRVALNADTRFIKGVFTQAGAVVSQAQKVLYKG
jgi:hypothetical protein